MEGKLFVLTGGPRIYARKSTYVSGADGGMYSMEAADCVNLVPVQQGRTTGFAVIRCSEWPEKPKQIAIPVEAVALVMDVHDPNLLKLIEATLAGIIAPGPGNMV